MENKIIRFVDHFVNFLIILCFLPLLLFGIYAVWDSEQIYKQADMTVYETYKPTSEDNLSFEELKELNSEVFGWLQVEQTHIDYPIVQSEDNSKYVNTDVKGEFSLSGTIFLDCKNRKDFSDMNNILYGHQMEKHKMFGDLKYFSEESYFGTHKNGSVYYESQWHAIDFFAFLYVDAYDSVIYNTGLYGDDDQEMYLSYVKSHAIHYRQLDFQTNEHFITLSTCSNVNTNERYVLIGRISDAERQPDKEKESEERRWSD